MLSYKQALKKLLDALPEGTSDSLGLDDSLGLVLAETIRADLDLPPFDKSFMDGYALRVQDLTGDRKSLPVAGIIAAGSGAPKHLRPGEAWQIMTGAMVPPGADAVQMIEKTRRHGDQVELLEPVQAGSHIAPRGSDVKKGDVVLEPGRVLGPAEIGVLATFGRTRVQAYRRLRAAVVSTGDELVRTGSTPRLGQIRNSNAHMLQAQCRAIGLETTMLPIVPDEPEAIRRALRAGLRRHDALVLSGGVSMGEFDFVHRVLGEEDVEVFFHKAAIKPGKPLIVGRRNNRMVFGLPGNPVSSFVTFELFARPAFRKWMGFKRWGLPVVRAQMAKSVRQKPGRLFFKPARTRLREGTFHVTPVETRGSADIVAFSRCNSLLMFPADQSEIKRGAMVEVMLLEIRE